MRFGFGNFVKAVVSAVGAAVCVFGVCLMRTSVFEGGEKSYYLYSASSQAQIKSAISLSELPYITGESATYVFEAGDGGEAEGILEKYRAEVCFTEEAGGVLSFYCYSPDLKGGLILNGYKVNLHIAVGEGRLAVGTPIIFGGY